MKQGVPQASLRAQWNDHAELRVGAKRKNTFSSRLLAVEAREAVRRQAIGKSRWQTAGLSTIRACQKDFFDKLRAVFQNFLSSEKPVIANERHP